MGAGAYYRGNRVIRQQLEANMRPVEFEVMDKLNALLKYPDAGTPHARIRFQFDKNSKRWWVLDEKKGFAGFGYSYVNLHEAVKRWNVVITEYHDGAWIADPSETTTKEERDDDN